VKEIQPFKDKFLINGLLFDKAVISIGGRRSELINNLKKLGINIVPQKPALTSLEIEEKHFQKLSGVSLKNVKATAILKNNKKVLSGDILFTHKGITGPLTYNIASLFAKENYSKENPIKIHLDFINELDFDIQKLFDKNPHKEICNLISQYIPKSFAELTLQINNIDTTKKCSQINKNERKSIESILTDLTLTAIQPTLNGEIVACGGVDLKEINPKTMESTKLHNLYFCGEVIDIDGFCGGYNLQNCWSTGFVAGQAISA